jgi:hypothetical protein
MQYVDFGDIISKGFNAFLQTKRMRQEEERFTQEQSMRERQMSLAEYMQRKNLELQQAQEQRLAQSEQFDQGIKSIELGSQMQNVTPQPPMAPPQGSISGMSLLDMFNNNPVAQDQFQTGQYYSLKQEPKKSEDVYLGFGKPTGQEPYPGEKYGYIQNGKEVITKFEEYKPDTSLGRLSDERTATSITFDDKGNVLVKIGKNTEQIPNTFSGIKRMTQVVIPNQDDANYISGVINRWILKQKGRLPTADELTTELATHEEKGWHNFGDWLDDPEKVKQFLAIYSQMQEKRAAETTIQMKSSETEPVYKANLGKYNTQD